MASKYDVIATWHREGLATIITRQGWYILSSARRCTATHFIRLRTYFTQGYPPSATDADRPYLMPHPATPYENTWADMIYALTRDRYYLWNTARFVQDRANTDTLQAIARGNAAPATVPTTDDESASSSSSYTTSSSSWRQNRAPAHSWRQSSTSGKQ